MKQAEENADKDWKSAAFEAVRRMAYAMPELNAKDAFDRIAPEFATHEPRAMGPVMDRARKAGLIEATDRVVASGRSRCHNAPARVWKSLVYSR